MFQREETRYPKARKGGRFTYDQAKKIAVATTAAGVLLVLFLVIILIVQFVLMGSGNAELKELEEKSEQLDQMINDEEKDLEYYHTQDGLYRLAIRQGWNSSH